MAPSKEDRPGSDVFGSDDIDEKDKVKLTIDPESFADPVEKHPKTLHLKRPPDLTEEHISKKEKKTADEHAIFYVASTLTAGYSEAAVKKELHRNNYSDAAIKSAFSEGKKRMEHSHFKLPSHKQQISHIEKSAARGMPFNEKIFIFLYSVLVLFMIGWLSIETMAPPLIVFLSFCPTLATIIASLLFFSSGRTKYKIMVWSVPIFTCIIWYAVASSAQITILNKVDAANITILNFLLSIVYLLILDLFDAIDNLLIRPIEKRIIKAEKELERTEKEHIHRLVPPKKAAAESHLENKITIHEQEKSIEQYIQSIEDKAKALNFVIGRVYSNKHGGSDELRSLIRINKESYNVFAEIPPAQIANNLDTLRQAVYSIGERLNVMDKTEHEVFGSMHKNLNNLNRKDDGSQRIIDVMTQNDKDPVITYFKSAAEFCNKAVNEIDLIAAKKKHAASSELLSGYKTK